MSSLPRALFLYWTSVTKCSSNWSASQPQLLVDLQASSSTTRSAVQVSSVMDDSPQHLSVQLKPIWIRSRCLPKTSYACSQAHHTTKSTTMLDIADRKSSTIGLLPLLTPTMPQITLDPNTNHSKPDPLIKASQRLQKNLLGIMFEKSRVC